MTITTEEAEIFAAKCSVLGMANSATALRSLAAERDALQAENARLREALRYYADDNYNGYNGNGAHARAALGEKE
jgi:CO dehydrogenase/acetyl-CoA synthase epsilon subunit